MSNQIRTIDLQIRRQADIVITQRAETEIRRNDVNILRGFLVLGGLSRGAADRDVSQSAAFSPVPLAALAEMTWLRHIIVVVVTKFRVWGITSRAFQLSLNL